MSMKNSNDTIGNRNRDFPTCSAVPEPTEPPFHCSEFSSFCNSYHLFTLPFLSKQTRHGKNIISFYFFLFINGRAKCLSREQCAG